jgi:hypothetical protein
MMILDVDVIDNDDDDWFIDVFFWWRWFDKIYIVYYMLINLWYNRSDKEVLLQQLHATYKELDDAFRHKMTEGSTPIFSLSYYPNNPNSNIVDDQPESAVYETTSYSHVESMGMSSSPNNHSTPGLYDKSNDSLNVWLIVWLIVCLTSIIMTIKLIVA